MTSSSNLNGSVGGNVNKGVLNDPVKKTDTGRRRNFCCFLDYSFSESPQTGRSSPEEACGVGLPRASGRPDRPGPRSEWRPTWRKA